MSVSWVLGLFSLIHKHSDIQFLNHFSFFIFDAGKSTVRVLIRVRLIITYICPACPTSPCSTFTHQWTGYQTADFQLTDIHSADLLDLLFVMKTTTRVL